MTWIARTGVLLALTLFASLSLRQINLPGLQNDEAQEAGLQALQLVRGLPTSAFRGAGVEITGQLYPLMAQDYIGAFHIYLATPFVALLGPTPLAARLPAVILGLLALALLYRLMSRVVSPLAGALAALLLAVHPSFVFWMRQGTYVTNVTLPLGIGAALAGAAWAQNGRRLPAFAAGLCAGLAVYAKLLSLWLLGGLAGSLLLLNLPALIRPRHPLHLWPRTPSRGELIGCLAGALSGLAPLVAYNLQTGGTVQSLAGNLATSFYGVNNLDYWVNLAARWDQFRAVLSGRDHLWYLGGSAGNPLAEWAVYGAAVMLVAATVPALRGDRRRPTVDAGGSWLAVGGPRPGPLALFFPLTMALAILQSPFSVSGIFPTHFAVLLWLPPCLIALAAHHLIQLRRLVRVAVFAGLAVVLARDLSVDLAYHRFLQSSGGLGPHSDSIYRLREALAGLPPGTQLVAMDWGFAPQLRYLSGEEVAPVEVFGYGPAPDSEFAARLRPFLEQPGAVFIFHWPQETLFPRREAFDALLAERGLGAHVLQDIVRRDGAPVFRLAVAGPVSP